MNIPTSWAEVEHRFNTGIFSYRDPSVGLANSGHTMESRYLTAQGIIAATSLVAGGMAVRGAYRATAGIRGAITWMRHPVAKYLAVYRSGTALGRGAKVYLQASKGLRYANYVAFAMNPLATYHYIRNDEYDKAMIQYFGPIGSVYVYNKFTESRGKGGGSQARTRLREDTRTRRPGSKRTSRKAKMPEKQRMRLWRMGLRWCKKHGRYDRCSLRARR